MEKQRVRRVRLFYEEAGHITKEHIEELRIARASGAGNIVQYFFGSTLPNNKSQKNEKH